MPSLLVVGYNAWDILAPLPAPIPRDAKLETPGLTMGGGGPAATAAVALARLGARVRLVTPLADDLAGRLQRQELATAGVDLTLSPRRRGAASPLAVSLIDADGSRAILWRRGELAPLTAAEVDAAWLDGIDVLLCDSHEPAAAAALARAARDRGVPVVLDGGSVRPGLPELVGLCDDVIASAAFAPALTGEPDPGDALRALARRGPARVAVTCGPAGCLWLADGAVGHRPAFAVPVVDTTGAGDAFHAGYAFARGLGHDFDTCLAWGAAVAALACRGVGGRAGLPTRTEVEALLRDGRPRPERPSWRGRLA
ncbi:MAG: carbohydrate kinase family protein [Candidatus Krumholzibacteriia bacterium]